MEERRRLTLEQIEDRHPRLLTTLRGHPHIGFLLVRSTDHGPVVLGAHGARYLAEQRVEGDDPLRPFPVNAAAHLCRADTFEHAPDVFVNSFYDPALEQGCAFEELISFHGGLGGPQTRPFILYPVELPVPGGPIVGASAVHELLCGWRALLQGDAGLRAGDGAVQTALAPPASPSTGLLAPGPPDVPSPAASRRRRAPDPDPGG